MTAHGERPRPTAVVVDDEAAVVNLPSLVLKDLRIRYRTATDTETALQLVEESRPDVLVTDERLRGMYGHELAWRLRRRPGLTATPIVLMSAYGEPGHSADHFFAKPSNIDELGAVLASYAPEA